MRVVKPVQTGQFRQDPNYIFRIMWEFFLVNDWLFWFRTAKQLGYAPPTNNSPSPINYANAVVNPCDTESHYDLCMQSELWYDFMVRFETLFFSNRFFLFRRMRICHSFSASMNWWFMVLNLRFLKKQMMVRIVIIQVFDEFVFFLLFSYRFSKCDWRQSFLTQALLSAIGVEVV